MSRNILKAWGGTACHSRLKKILVPGGKGGPKLPGIHVLQPLVVSPGYVRRNHGRRRHGESRTLPGAHAADQRATAFSSTPYFTYNPGDAFKAWDAKATFDFMPSQFLTWRFEYTHRASNVPHFTGPGGVTPAGGNTSGAPGSFVPNWAPEISERGRTGSSLRCSLNSSPRRWSRYQVSIEQ